MKATVSVAEPAVPLKMMMFKGELQSAFEQAAKIGYDGVELFLFSAEASDGKKIKELLDRAGLKVGMVAAIFDLIQEDIVMGHPDSSVRRKFIERAPAHLKLASQLDALVPVGFTRGAIRKDTTERDIEGWFTETLPEYARMANDMGVTLILEPINRHEINYINKVEEALRIVNNLGLPNLKLLLDSYHMNIEELSIPNAIFSAAEHIGHFHFVDSNRWPPGYGHTDMKEIYFSLRQVGYTGYLGVEAMPKPDGPTGARWGIDYIRMLDRLWEEMRQS